jgi:predicted kinase
MPAPYSVDPDQFLDLSRATPFSREEGLAAWEQAYARLRKHLRELGRSATLYVVFGVQASGKTTWVLQQLAAQPRNAVYFSGPLPSRKHRSRVLAMAKEFDCKAVAVHVVCTLEVALARNAVRSGLARVPEDVVHHVYESLEAATTGEGFSEVIVVTPARAEAQPFARADPFRQD